MRGLADKIAIVTGAGGAIGRAISLRLADEGDFVGVLDRDEEAAAETVQLIAVEGGRAESLIADITDYAAIERVVQHFEQHRGPIDILVNNAGWDRRQLSRYRPALVGAARRDQSHRPLEHASRRGSRHGRAGGTVVNIFVRRRSRWLLRRIGLRRRQGRHHLLHENPGAGNWPAAASTSTSSAPDRPIRRCWHPSPARARRATSCAALQRAIPMKRLGQPGDIAGIVTFLASEEAQFITGQVISVSGGLTMQRLGALCIAKHSFRLAISTISPTRQRGILAILDSACPSLARRASERGRTPKAATGGATGGCPPVQIHLYISSPWLGIFPRSLKRNTKPIASHRQSPGVSPRMSYEDVLYEERDGVATITINRPQVHNAFRADVRRVDRGVLRAGGSPEVGVIVLSGAGRQSFLQRRRSVGPGSADTAGTARWACRSSKCKA